MFDLPSGNHVYGFNVVNGSPVAVFIRSIRFSWNVAGVIHFNKDLVALLMQIELILIFSKFCVKKVKLSLCVFKYNALKMCCGSEFFTSALDGGRWSALLSGHFTPRERTSIHVT